MKRLLSVVPLFFLAAWLGGCLPSERPDARNSTPQPDVAAEAEPSSRPAAGDASEKVASADGPVTPDQLQAALKEKNPNFTGTVDTQLGPQGIAVVVLNDPAIEDISPLAGLPLYVLDLHDCHIDRIDSLQGMRLARIDLSNTAVSDVSVLSGMPLELAYFNNSRVTAAPSLSAVPMQIVDFSDTPLTNLDGLKGATIGELYLVNTKVKDIGPLREARVRSVWLNNAPVEDCSPLAENPVVSVTLAGTKVSDISCFKGHSTLQRLHIAETEVTDLSPLQWMGGLTRLIFTPNRVKTGIEYARRMPSIQEIGTAFGTPGDEGKMFPPEVFWQMYDEGKFK